LSTSSFSPFKADTIASSEAFVIPSSVPRAVSAWKDIKKWKPIQQLVNLQLDKRQRPFVVYPGESRRIAS
jgi:hypothetical protein